MRTNSSRGRIRDVFEVGACELEGDSLACLTFWRVDLTQLLGSEDFDGIVLMCKTRY